MGVRLPLAELIAAENVRRRRRSVFLWGLLAAVPLLIGLTWWMLRPQPIPFSARFRELPVTQGDLVREVLATGRLEAVTTVQVGAEISGRIASVEVDYNARVKAGQTLATFDRESLQAQKAQANALLAASRAGLEQAKTDLGRIRADLARLAKLRASNAVSEADFDAAQANARVAEQRVVAAEAQFAAQQAVYSLSETSLAHSVIRSPIDGIVISRNVDPGQTVVAALQTPVLFVVAADLEKMRVIVSVDEADIGELAVGQSAAFTVNAYPERTFQGAVTEIRNAASVVQDVVTYGTVVQVANPDLALKPGMTASVRIRTAEANDVLKVPNAALRFNPPGETASPGQGVWMRDKNELRRVQVQAGVSDGEDTMVASGSLRVGDQVIVELTPEGRKAYATPSR
jgi:HlyD family secretion protein